MVSADAGTALATLRQLCVTGLETLPIDSMAVTVMNGAGHGGVVHATSAAAARLEDSEFTLGEGPAMQAFQSGTPVLVSDLDGAETERWPIFAQRAQAEGCQAVFAFPLQIGAITVGTMTCYAGAPTVLSQTHLARAHALTPAAARALLNHVDGSVSGRWAEDAVPGENGTFIRAEAYQASGMVMAQLGVPIHDAMLTLRAFAFTHDRSINDVAHDVVTRAIRFQPDTA